MAARIVASLHSSFSTVVRHDSLIPRQYSGLDRPTGDMLMGFRSNGVNPAGLASDANPVLHPGDDWPLSREAHEDLQAVGRLRANLMVLGVPEVTRLFLRSVQLDLREPILTWYPGQPLELPPPDRAATLILLDVDKLTSPD